MKTDKLQTMKQKAGKKGFKVPKVSCSLFQSFFSILLVILRLSSFSACLKMNNMNVYCTSQEMGSYY